MVEPRARKYHRDRVAETLREEISGMIVGELADPRISFAYVSEVVLNPGGKSARVYIAVDGGEVEEEKTRECLGRYAGYLRRAGILHDELAESMRAEATETMRAGIAAAEVEPPADPELLFAHAYVDPPASFGSDLEELRRILG